MTKFARLANFELIYIIVNSGMGSKILHKSRDLGIPGGTICLGKGTVNNSILNFLSLYDERKEIVLLGTDKHTADHVLAELNREFKFEKPHHGIAFTTSACQIIDTVCKDDLEKEDKRGVSKIMYQLIFTIVSRGKAEEVIEAAQAAGSKGGTIINARGSGVNETFKLFNMDVEPEKEIVMIVSKEDITQGIVRSIREKLEIDKPGHGIIFVQDINDAYGIYE
ncbi:MAG: P-II family nitrogen regulator [Clostridiales bacterium]|nr:P-II family nitrogen regulator [Clostridiales bacterium]